MRHLHINNLADLVVWMRASRQTERKVHACFLASGVKAVQGDLTKLMAGLARQLVDATAEDAGYSASFLILEVLSVINLRAEAVRAPGVLDALIAALYSPDWVVRTRALASLSSTVITVRDDLVARGLLPRLLTILASNDLAAATEADTILFCTVGAYTPHHVAFVEAGGPDIVRRLIREGRPWVSDQWPSVLRGLHGAGTTYTAVYSRDDEGGWFVQVPELRGCHSHGRTIDEARARIREAFDLCVPGADQAEILDVVQPRRGTALTRPTCSYCGRMVDLTPRVRSYGPKGRVTRVQVRLWECLYCPDPFTGEPPFRFTDCALSEASDAEARWAWAAVYGEPMPEPMPERKRVPGAARPRVGQVIEATLASDVGERLQAPGHARPDQFVVHALLDGDGLGVTFADGLRARVPTMDVRRTHRYAPSAITLSEAEPFGVMVRFGRLEYELLPWDWLRGFGQTTG